MVHRKFGCSYTFANTSFSHRCNLVLLFITNMVFLFFTNACRNTLFLYKNKVYENIKAQNRWNLRVMRGSCFTKAKDLLYLKTTGKSLYSVSIMQSTSESCTLFYKKLESATSTESFLISRHSFGFLVLKVS